MFFSLKWKMIMKENLENTRFKIEKKVTLSYVI